VQIFQPFCDYNLYYNHDVVCTVMAEHKKSVSDLDPEQEKIFNRRFNQHRWDQIRQRLGLGDFKSHDLRKAFGSVPAQNGISTAVTQTSLEHSSS
jgi:integrase